MTRTWQNNTNTANPTNPSCSADSVEQSVGNVSQLHQTITPADIAADIHNAADAVEPDELVFKPTREMRKARALFYAVAKSRKFDMRNLTCDAVAALIPSVRTLRQWWHNELFVEWFINARSYQERIDYLIDLQLDNLEDVITNREGTFTASDQVRAGRQLAEYKKAFIDEAKVENKVAADGDLVKALAARMMAARQIASPMGPVDDTDVDNRPIRVELPD